MADAGHVGHSGRGLTVKGLRGLEEQLIPGLRNVCGGVGEEKKNKKQTPPGVSELDRLISGGGDGGGEGRGGGTVIERQFERSRPAGCTIRSGYPD